jgi:hypothetical protein
MKLEFSEYVLKKKKSWVSNVIKIRPVGAELFHADRHVDGWTEMTKLIVAFRNMAKAPKNNNKCCHLDH